MWSDTVTTYERPSQSTGDIVHASVKAALSLVPVVGGPAAELFALVMAAPLARRRDEWVESIASGLRELEQRVEGFHPESLAENESFITSAVRATQAAMRTHEDEKLRALRNATLNAALANAPETSIQEMYVRFVDELTTWHIRVLKILDDPAVWAQMHGVPLPNLSIGAPATVLESLVSELRNRRDFYDLLVRDLHARSLLTTDSLHGTMTGSGAIARRSTDFGRSFLQFISEPR